MPDPALLRRAHPLSIIRYLGRFLFLLVVPFLRGFLSALTGGFIAWLSGAWIDLLVILSILALAYLKWYKFKYYMCKDLFYYTNGIVFYQQTCIPLTRISSFSTQKAFWLRPLRLTKIVIDTIALGTKNADLTFYVRDEEAARLLEQRLPQAEIQSGRLREFSPGICSLLFLSLFTSNSLLGVLLLSTFISQAGQLLGDELSYTLISSLESLSQKLAVELPSLTYHLTAGMVVVKIPPIAAGVALVLLAGWLVAFLVNLLQARKLSTRRTDSFLCLQAGTFVFKTFCIKLSDICFLDIRQSLVTRLFRLYSVYINAIGLGKEKSDIAAIIPFASRQRVFDQLTRLMPEYFPSPRTIRPNLAAIFKFILQPLLICALVPAVTFLGIFLLPRWDAIFYFAGFMGMLPAIWFLGVRIIDFCSSGVSKEGTIFTIRYSKLFHLHTVIFSEEQLMMVNIRQSILQRRRDKCDLLISTRAEGRYRHHLRNLDRKACIALFGASPPET